MSSCCLRRTVWDSSGSVLSALLCSTAETVHVSVAGAFGCYFTHCEGGPRILRSTLGQNLAFLRAPCFRQSLVRCLGRGRCTGNFGFTGTTTRIFPFPGMLSSTVVACSCVSLRSCFPYCRQAQSGLLGDFRIQRNAWFDRGYNSCGSFRSFCCSTYLQATCSVLYVALERLKMRIFLGVVIPGYFRIQRLSARQWIHVWRQFASFGVFDVFST